MSKSSALILSVIFHPLFVNALSMWLLFALFPQLSYGVHPTVKLIYMGFVFVSTGIIPLLWVVISGFINKEQNLLLDNKEDRNLPYIVTSSLYLFDFYLSKKLGAPMLVSAYLLACSSIVVVVLITNLFTKISIHAASLGALVAIIISASSYAMFDIRYLLSLGIIASGLVLSARLFLNTHINAQVYSGFFAGFILMILIL